MAAYGAVPYAGGPYANIELLQGQQKYKPRSVPFVGGVRQRLNFVAILLCLIIPSAIFCSTFAALTLKIHHSYPALSYGICCCAGLVTTVCVLLGSNAQRKKIWPGPEGTYEPSWFIFLGGTAIFAFIVAVYCGEENYYNNTKPYWDLMSLNTYTNISPTRMRGQQLLDAGRITFSAGSSVDVTKSMSFQSVDTYCVAPITLSVPGPGLPASDLTVDFWAVGKNCCASQQADYHCGEFNNPYADGGLRLMNEEDRTFFRLAVQQAESVYNIRAVHPLFFHWMQDPTAAMQNFMHQGEKWLVCGIIAHFVFQLFAVCVASLAFAKLGRH